MQTPRACTKYQPARLPELQYKTYTLTYSNFPAKCSLSNLRMPFRTLGASSNSTAYFIGDWFFCLCNSSILGFHSPSQYFGMSRCTSAVWMVMFDLLVASTRPWFYRQFLQSCFASTAYLAFLLSCIRNLCWAADRSLMVSMEVTSLSFVLFPRCRVELFCLLAFSKPLANISAALVSDLISTYAVSAMLPFS